MSFITGINYTYIFIMINKMISELNQIHSLRIKKLNENNVQVFFKENVLGIFNTRDCLPDDIDIPISN